MAQTDRDGATNSPNNPPSYLTWRGVWSTGLSYTIYDIFFYGGSSYIVLLAHTSGVFATDLASGLFELMAAQGTAGAGTGDMLAANNLSEVTPGVARGNLNAALEDSEGAAVVAATTSDIWASDGNTRHITGNTTITSFGTAPRVGARMKLIFDGTPILAQSANLNLNAGGSNITIEAGDWAEVYADTTTQLDVFVHRANGAAIAAVADASTTVKGKVELATTAEMAARTDTTRAVTPESLQGILVSGTKINTTSGSSQQFSSIPAWVKRFQVAVSALSTNGSAEIKFQIGDSGGLKTTGYSGSYSVIGSGSATSINMTSGFGILTTTPAYSIHGIATFVLIDAATNTWAYSFTGGASNANNTLWGGGSVALSAVLDRVALVTTDTLDAGMMQILYD